MTETKASLRKTLRATRKRHVAALPDSTRALLFRMPPAPLRKLIPAGATVGLYRAGPDEAPAAAYARWFQENGHPIALPRFADRDAPKTPAQIAAVEPMARGLFPLGRPVEAEPWMGARPCTPDMLPIIGPAPRHKDLWFAFGHAHHGLTLGPVTGRLIAQMMTGAQTFVDPAPFRADRF